ncbi:hypothetical protein GH714_035765 [Hevea brasiliensis]|uniref:Uncharacterized protein n=1 Tax=Hevea brasiliensis TaxID=3981 RepID=A0A6A6KDH2_HEVBR|nr:hypothetical protein GH714_035765 [Hevea brasiliensis]
MLDLKGPDMGVVKGKEGFLDVFEAALVLSEIDEIAALEIDLNEDQNLVVLAENRLEEAAAANDVLEDQIEEVKIEN